MANDIAFYALEDPLRQNPPNIARGTTIRVDWVHPSKVNSDHIHEQMRVLPYDSCDGSISQNNFEDIQDIVGDDFGYTIFTVKHAASLQTACLKFDVSNNIFREMQIQPLVTPGQAPVCAPCPADFFKATAHNVPCDACARDQQSPVRSNASEACTCNRGYTGPDGAEHGPCATCRAGTFKNASGPQPCTLCPRGTFMEPTDVARDDITFCQSCEPGTTSAVGSGGGNASCVGECPPGTFGNVHANLSANIESLCTPCAENSYKSVVGESECVSCPVGTSTIGEERSFCQCDAGRSGPRNPVNDTDCVPCQPGSYKEDQGPGNCTLCGVGKYGRNRDVRDDEEDSCDFCDKGKFQPLLGQHGREACQACPAGTFQGEIGAGLLEACQKCPPGTYQPLTGAIFGSQCLFCPAGKFSNISGATHLENCTDCPAGTYGLELGLEVVEECIACGPGTYNPEPGQSTAGSCQGLPRRLLSQRHGRHVSRAMHALPARDVCLWHRSRPTGLGRHLHAMRGWQTRQARRRPGRFYRGVDVCSLRRWHVFDTPRRHRRSELHAVPRGHVFRDDWRSGPRPLPGLPARNL